MLFKLLVYFLLFAQSGKSGIIESIEAINIRKKTTVSINVPGKGAILRFMPI